MRNYNCTKLLNVYKTLFLNFTLVQLTNNRSSILLPYWVISSKSSASIKTSI